MKRLNQAPETAGSRKTLKVVKMGVVVVAAFVFLEIWLVNHLSTYGGKIQQLKNTEVDIRLENQVLESQIAESTSLNTLEKEAQGFGFDNIKNLEYLNSPVVASAR